MNKFELISVKEYEKTVAEEFKAKKQEKRNHNQHFLVLLDKVLSVHHSSDNSKLHSLL